MRNSWVDGTRADDRNLAIVVPDGATNGDLLVTVAGIASNPTPFKVLKSLALNIGDWYLTPGATTGLEVAAFDTAGAAVKDAAHFWSIQGTAAALSGNDIRGVSPGTASLLVQNGTLSASATITVLPAGTVTVNTLAGAHEPSFADATGPRARFNGPSGVAVGADGTVYIADRFNHRIRTLDRLGHAATLAGGAKGFADAAGSAAQFDEPLAIARAPVGELFVVDSGNFVVRRSTAGGSVTTLNGKTTVLTAPEPYAAFFSPLGLAIGPDGRVFVADYASIWAVHPGSGDTARTTKQFGHLGGVIFDAAGLLYGADLEANTINKVNSDGSLEVLAGSVSGFADGAGGAARFKLPRGLALGPDGNLYLADSENHRIRKITLPDGVVSTVAGGNAGDGDGSAAAAQFRRPVGLTFGADRRLYVVEELGHRVRVIDGL